jgi:hypothetical protein
MDRKPMKADELIARLRAEQSTGNDLFTGPSSGLFGGTTSSGIHAAGPADQPTSHRAHRRAR